MTKADTRKLVQEAIISSQKRAVLDTDKEVELKVIKYINDVCYGLKIYDWLKTNRPEFYRPELLEK